MGQAGSAGGLFSLMIAFPLVWLALGSLFIMVAFRDRGDPENREGSTRRADEALQRLPNLAEHPLRQVHVALVASRAASRKARERAAVERAGGEAPAEPRQRPAASRRGGRHMKRVV
jgi:hypothetical protein